jgi:hypothetical protein
MHPSEKPLRSRVTIINDTNIRMDPPVALPIDQLSDLSEPLASTWNIVKVGFGGDNRNSKVERHSGRTCLRVAYPKGSVAPSCAPERPLGGIGFYAAPTRVFPCTEAVLEYSLFFDKSFDACKGGKLPGLFMSLPGASNFKGGSGGKKNDTTASCRLMWRQNLDAEAYVYRPPTQAPQYALIPSAVYNQKYGDSLWRGKLKFMREKWNSVRIHVRLNTIGRQDGLVEVQINDAKVAYDSMVWRTDPRVLLSCVLFDTFFGGNSVDYACPIDCCTRFRDVRVSCVAQ